MAIREHPALGTVVMCDFNPGFAPPEMVKHRPVIVISPKIQNRYKLCTIVCLSTDPPDPIMPYHCQIDIRPSLPDRWSSNGVWVKGDMIYTVGFHRVDLIRLGKDRAGKRIYLTEPLDGDTIKKVRECMLRSVGLAALTKHL